MNEVVPGDGSSAPAGLPLKRGRGRPRKDPSLKRVAGPQVPRIEHTQSQQIDLNKQMMTGMAVTGVVETEFRDGFLLSCKIGDCDTDYRAVVFKPGHFTPVTRENDVAPHLPMIRRSRSKRGKRNGSLGEVSRSPKGKKNGPITVHPSVPSVGARGTVVPVELRPVNAPDGIVESVKEKVVQTVAPLAMLPPNGSVTSQAQAASSGLKPLMNYGTGRMIELLQAVQENHQMENEMRCASGSGPIGTKSAGPSTYSGL